MSFSSRNELFPDSGVNVTSSFPFEYKLVRSKRRTLSVCVKRFGEVVVRAPLRCKESDVIRFLSEKSNWIERKIQEARLAAKKGDVVREAANNAVFLWLGVSLKIVLLSCEDNAKRTRRGVKQIENTLYVPSENATEHLVAFLKKSAKRYLEKVVADCAAEMGANYQSVSVNGARSRWGSCSYCNKLNFSFRLLFCPKEVVRYVVIHELAHTFQKNHSSEFWKIVRKFDPQYLEKRAFLKKNAYYMEAL